MWLLTCVCWIIMFTLTFIIYALMANSIGHLFFKKTTFLAFEPLAKAPITSIKYYIVFQAVFLVGAVHFRGYVFPKTIFALLLFGMVCGIIFYVIMADIIHSDVECPAGYQSFEGRNLASDMAYCKVVGMVGNGSPGLGNHLCRS